MQRTIVPGIAMWSRWQPDRNLFFNSFFVTETPDGNAAIDPLPLDDADASEIAARGGVAWIVVTNRDHERDARALAARFGARLAASALDVPSLAGPVDRALVDGDTICGAEVVALAGLKTPGEFALAFRERRTVVLGDALWGDPAGSLRLMPDDKLADPPRAVLSLRRVHALRPQHLLVGDGTCVFGDASRVLWACLEARTDAYVNRINLDDAVWQRYNDEPEWFRGGASFDVDAFVGGEKLGYRVARVAPGMSFCPEHWHTAEEELFFVIDGEATLRGPRGRVALRRGDFIAFPTRASGSHELINESAAPCLVLMISNADARDVCFYPNSGKLAVEMTGHIVRDAPILDYFEGESGSRDRV